jgi:hypothetical protein
VIETHPFLTSQELAAGFLFRGERIPLVNPQRGIPFPSSPGRRARRAEREPPRRAESR